MPALPPKCVICVAPHTSNLDFLIGISAWYSLGRRACFLMKKQWFFWPMGALLRKMGGIPVDRSDKGRGKGMSHQLAEMFASRSELTLAVTPEGTRSATTKWKTGFLRIAAEAHVPLLLGVLDYRHKIVKVLKEFHPSADIEADLRKVKEFYADKGDLARYPAKFNA